jgi:hypothetical protein
MIGRFDVLIEKRPKRIKVNEPYTSPGTTPPQNHGAHGRTMVVLWARENEFI